MSDVFVLAASAAVIVFMVVVAALLGFRQTVRLDEGALQRIAESEGGRVADAAIAAAGKVAFARLDSGRILAARVIADGVSTRTVAASAVRIRLTNRRARIAFADIGFPPISVRFGEEPPAWVVAFAREQAHA